MHRKGNDVATSRRKVSNEELFAGVDVVLDQARTKWEGQQRKRGLVTKTDRFIQLSALVGAHCRGWIFHAFSLPHGQRLQPHH
jgi:hypothetical protein